MGYQWQDRAACLGMPPELFEHDYRRGVNNVQATEQAAAACAACPVFAECEADGDRTWVGGITRAGQVSKSRKNGRRKYLVAAQTGTWEEAHGHGTWQRAGRCTNGDGGRPCEACRDARARQKSPNGTTSNQHGVFPSDAATRRLGVSA